MVEEDGISVEGKGWQGQGSERRRGRTNGKMASSD